MRTHLITLTAILSCAGLVAASAASAGGGSSGGGASAGGGSSGGGGGGGAHGGGGGHGGGGFGGGSHVGGGYAAHGGYVAHGVDGARGGYGIVGYEHAGLGRGEAAARDGHVARNTLLIGPRAGSAAAATRVSDRHMHPQHPHRHPNCYSQGGLCFSTSEIPETYCPPTRFDTNYPAAGCPPASKAKVLAR
jgi:hypothetical protein